MKRFGALSVALLMVLSACGGDTGDAGEEVAVETVLVRAECSDIGHFQESVAQLATIVSDSDAYSIQVLRRVDSAGQVAYRIEARIAALNVRYVDFANARSPYWAATYQVSNGWPDNLSTPITAVSEELLCPALDELAAHFGFETPHGDANLGVATAFEKSFELLSAVSSDEYVFHRFELKYHGEEYPYRYFVYASGGPVQLDESVFATDHGDDIVKVLRNVLRDIEYELEFGD